MKRSFTNKKTQVQNQEVFKLYFDRLHDICLTVFKWSGLPFDPIILPEVELYLNEILWRGETAAFIKVKTDDFNADRLGGYIPIIGTAVPSDALTWYGGSNNYTIQTKTATFHGTRDNVALCRPTPAKRSLFEVAARYALLLAQADSSIHVNMVNQNTPAIIQSPPGQELTYANMFEQVAGFKPVVYGREGLLGNEKEGIFAYRYLQPATYVSDKLEMLKHDLLNDFLNEIGVSAKSIEKKAQLISDELNLDFTANSLSKNIFLDVRQDFCDQIAAIYGDVVTIEFNCDVIYALRDFQMENVDNRGTSGTSGSDDNAGVEA